MNITALCAVSLLACTALAGCSNGAAAGTSAPSPAPLGSIARGEQVFRANCSACHTADGSAGGVGPSLQHENKRKDFKQTVAWIKSPEPPMPKLYPAPMSEQDVRDVVAYVQSL